MDSLTSIKTQLPLPADNLPFQQNSNPFPRSLGQALSGLLPQSSGYEIIMKQDKYCQILCEANMDTTPNLWVKLIQQEYYQNFVLDGLPAASILESEYMFTTRYWRGIPMGFEQRFEGIAGSENMVHIYNHMNFIIQYHDMGNGKYQVTRFTMQPFSIQHKVEYQQGKVSLKNSLESCAGSDGSLALSHTHYDMIAKQGRIPQGVPMDQVIFTYDVIWQENVQTTWSKRWDIYVTMDKYIPAKVHWFSLVNSLILLTILLGVVVALLRYHVGTVDGENPVNEAESNLQLDSLRDKGYTMIHTTYFDPPENETSVWLLTLFCGTGAQLLATILTTILLACTVEASFFSSNGRLFVCQLVLFALFGGVNGFVSMQTSKFLKADLGWKGIALASSLCFPSLTYAFFLFGQTIARVHHSSSLLSVPHQLIILCLWLVLMTPLTVAGSYVGHRLEPMLSIPTTPRSVVLRLVNYRAFQHGDRQTKCRYVCFLCLLNVALVPLLICWCLRHWLIGVRYKRYHPYLNPFSLLLVSGAVGGSVVYVELYFILSAFWLRFYYSAYPFLFVIVLLFMITSAAVSMIFSFTQLTVEDSHSWWQQFLCGGSSGFLFLTLSVGFMLEMELSQISSSLLFLGYTVWLALSVFLASGFVSLAASAWFAQTMFSIAKAGEPLGIKSSNENEDNSPTTTSSTVHNIDDSSAPSGAVA